MLTTHINELRLHIPSQALDNIANVQGFLDNSEQDFLRPRLGNALYERLCEEYGKLREGELIENLQNNALDAYPWQTLILRAQRVIVFDAMARFIPSHSVSVNASGVNVATADDYNAATDRQIRAAVDTYKREALVALNNLLVYLENLARIDASASPAVQPLPTTTEDLAAGRDPEEEAADTAAAEEEIDDTMAEIHDIVTLWKTSDWYFNHADLLIPTARCLQRYLDIYESRDRFIMLLPDIRFCQDEYISEVVGEDLVKAIVADTSTEGPVFHLKRRLRRLLTAYVEDRTQALDISRERRATAHNESVQLLTSVINYIKTNQTAFPREAMQTSPLYDPAKWPSDDDADTDAPADGNTPAGHTGHVNPDTIPTYTGEGAKTAVNAKEKPRRFGMRTPLLY